MADLQRWTAAALISLTIAGGVGACGANAPASTASQGTSTTGRALSTATQATGTAAQATGTAAQAMREADQVRADYLALERGVASDDGSEVCGAFPQAAQRAAVAGISDPRMRTCAQLLHEKASHLTAAQRRAGMTGDVKVLSIKGDVATLALTGPAGTVTERQDIVLDHGHWRLAGPVPTISPR